MCPRIGYQMQRLSGYHNLDGLQLASKVVAAAKGLRENEEEPVEIRVDETGVGASCVDGLRLVAKDHNLIIVPLNFGAAGDKHYADYGSKLWGMMRDSLPFIQLPEDDTLTAQMVTRKYHLQLDGRVKLEKKDHMKQRLAGNNSLADAEGASPDRADALALCLADLSDRPFAHDRIGSTRDDTEPAFRPAVSDDVPALDL